MTPAARGGWRHGEWRLRVRGALGRFQLRGVGDRAWASACAATGERDLVVLGVIDWESRLQRPQLLSAAMAARGWRMLYIDPTPYAIGRAKATVVGRRDGVWHCRLRYRGLRREDPHAMRMEGARADALSSGIASLMSRAGVRSPVVMAQHPYWAPVAQRIGARTLAYDCMDFHAAFADPYRSSFPPQEQQLLREAHVVTASSPGLREMIERMRPCTLVRNACDPSRFAAVPPPPTVGRPVVMYMGAISTWFDAPLVRAVAASMPDVDFRLVGSTRGCDVSGMASLPNVRLHGEVPHRALPTLLADASVGIMPFQINRLTAVTDPVKGYEYLAAGRPFVTTIPFAAPGLPDALVHVPRHTADAWVNALRLAIVSSRDPTRVALARTFGATQSWAQRAAELEQALTRSEPSALGQA